VHPVPQALPWARRVLVIGGGDGLALREILKYRNIEHVTLVDLDPAMTTLFSRSEPLRALNHGSLTDQRVTVVNADAAQWLEQNQDNFDAIIVDLPDPSNFGLGKLYSVPMYRLMSRHLAEKGYAVVQSTSPYYAPRSFWDIDATLREAGLHTWPYHTYVPSFGEWGFILAGKRNDYTPPTHYDVPMKFLDADTTALMFRFPADMAPRQGEPNRLNEQTLVHDFERDWRNVIR
jgi:spermidine synthase